MQVENLPDLDAAIGNAILGLDESMVLGLRAASAVLSKRTDDGSNQDKMYT